MTIGSVTARSHGGLTAANENSPPRKTNVERLRVSSPASRARKAARRATQLYSKKTIRSIGRVKSAVRQPRIVRTRIPASVTTRGLQHAIRNQQSKSLAQIAKLVTGNVLRTVARSTPLSLAAIIGADYLYNKVVEPDGFPGFENIGEGWRDEQHHLGFVPGDYVPNMFDVGPFGPPPARALLDSDDASIPLGIRYWGDFGVDPYPNPVPGTNWPTLPQWLPNPAVSPAAAPVPKNAPRHNRTKDISARSRPRPRWRARNNFRITIRLPYPGSPGSASVNLKRNVPRIREKPRDDKAKAANEFVYAVLITLANAMGETKEWIDILAEAAGYDRTSLTAPKSIQKGHETVKKAWWLFVDGGINDIDYDSLAVLIIENEIEDFLIGIAGRMSKHASRSLGLSTGLQTGPGL